MDDGRSLTPPAGPAAIPGPKAPLRARAGPAPAAPRPAPPRRKRGLSGGALGFLLLVLLPTLAMAFYTQFIAADLYVSESRFLVRSQKPSQGNILGAMLGAPASTASLEESLSIRDYILSHDAVAEIEKRVGLRAIYGSPDADRFSRLPADASSDQIVDYHRDMIDLRYHTQSGIVTLRATAYRRADAQRLAATILDISEELINRYNQRAQADALRVGREEVRLAEERVAQIRLSVTAFREKARSIDPTQSTSSVLAIMAALEARLSQTRTELAEARTYLAANSQLITALRNRIAAIEVEIEREKAKLTGSDGSLATVIAEYEKLQLQRDFADKGLASALLSLEQARTEAQRQQLFVIRIVAPNTPQRADSYRAWMRVASVFAIALLLYGIGALTLATIRDRIL